MIVVGQLCLLSALVCVGFSAFACVSGSRSKRPPLVRAGFFTAVTGFALLTVVMLVLVWALLAKDFRFQYVAQYSSRMLPWHYSLSALWVGQSGSLLLWTWMLGLLTLLFRMSMRRHSGTVRDCAFGLMMGYCGFLVATMVFAADPMERNIAPGSEGAGLSPLLQHPAMLIHPPIIFLGYALWTVPCGLAIAALLCHQRDQTAMDQSWVRIARPWALAAWTVLGSGILLGAYWSYEELGWGGYWAWDPVENGSLIPWLIGTAFVHTLMAWQYSGMLKKSSIALAIAGFAMCNFATFLTRSGIFSSLHAFSQSPIGWLFLGLMLVICVGGTILILRHRHALGTDRRVKNFWTRESLIVVSTITLVTLAAVTLAGTLSVALSDAIVGRRIIVGPPFYNHVLIPVALVLLATMAAAPLFRWSAEPSPKQKRAFKYSAAVASVSLMVVWFFGVRHPLGWVIGWLASFSIATHSACLALELWQRNDRQPWTALGTTLRLNRKLYAGFLIHIGFISIAVGLTGSSLGTRREELVMKQGQIVQWAGRTIQFRQLIERDLGDKYVVEAELIVSRGEADAYRLLPAQHLHRLQDQWTTEVDIHSTWRGDFYTILHYGEGDDEVRLTLVENPLMRWIWFGALVIVAATTLRLFPSRQFQNQPRIATQLIQRSGIRGKRRALETVGT